MEETLSLAGKGKDVASSRKWRACNADELHLTKSHGGWVSIGRNDIYAKFDASYCDSSKPTDCLVGFLHLEPCAEK